MPKGKSTIKTFKQVQQHQMMMLPPSLEELIPADHLVRAVNQYIEQLAIEPVLNQYKGGGASIYHPRTMLKILVYAYLSKIYSSRRIAKACREDVNFMWLGGSYKPDFRTINLFRSDRLKKVIDEVFGSLLGFMIANKVVKLESYFVDGTKLQADANKYSHVWKKNAQRHKGNTEEKIKELLRHIEEVNQREQLEYGSRDLEELGEESTLTPEKIKEHVTQLNERLQKKKQEKGLSEAEKQIGRAATVIEKKQLSKIDKYNAQLDKMQQRSSYSKTDEDATFMRMKNGQLLAGYNILMGTEQQYILNYTIHNQVGEPHLFIPHLNKFKQSAGQLPGQVVADSAYGSLENYLYLDEHHIGNYLKYLSFHREQGITPLAKRFTHDDFIYNKETNSYRCPAGEELNYKFSTTLNTGNGYPYTVHQYEAQDCSACALKEKCTTSNKRNLKVNPLFEYYKKKARENLNTAKGKELRIKRSTDVETVFANIKWNQGYQRIRLRGIQKANIEIGLLSLAHNIKKMAEA